MSFSLSTCLKLGTTAGLLYGSYVTVEGSQRVRRAENSGSIVNYVVGSVDQNFGLIVFPALGAVTGATFCGGMKTFKYVKNMNFVQNLSPSTKILFAATAVAIATFNKINGK